LSHSLPRRATKVDITSPETLAVAKTTCPITRAQFTADAKPVEVIINGIPLLAEVKEFSTGSLGWYRMVVAARSTLDRLPVVLHKDVLS
jgi:hypothetical protein